MKQTRTHTQKNTNSRNTHSRIGKNKQSSLSSLYADRCICFPFLSLSHTGKFPFPNPIQYKQHYFIDLSLDSIWSDDDGGGGPKHFIDKSICNQIKSLCVNRMQCTTNHGMRKWWSGDENWNSSNSKSPQSIVVKLWILSLHTNHVYIMLELNASQHTSAHTIRFYTVDLLWFSLSSIPLSRTYSFTVCYACSSLPHCCDDLCCFYWFA